MMRKELSQTSANITQMSTLQEMNLSPLGQETLALNNMMEQDYNNNDDNKTEMTDFYTKDQDYDLMSSQAITENKDNIHTLINQRLSRLEVQTDQAR